MRKNIKLFINNQEVNISEDLSLPITYSVEDFKNPTIVKNSFSKTITIPGTKQNNKIFGEIYKLDRFIIDHTGTPTSGVSFDPSKRVDFQIYNNSDLVESGYMQLNSISIKEAIVSYNITLYGGLGDFFYRLKYKEDGTNRTLADLRYFIEDSEGNVLPEDTEMDFTINKDFVNRCFNQDWSTEGNQLNDVITFVPAYNGLYENFDNSTCLINTVNDTIFPKSQDGYTPYNGYALAKLNKSYTEWEIRDLRSYMQRPALKLSKLIKAICNKYNSGYDVVFDNDFFNSNNPYWNNTVVVLPLLGSNEENEDKNTYTDQLTVSDNIWCGYTPSAGQYPVKGIIRDYSSTDLPSTNNIIDFTSLPATAFLNLDVDYQLNFVGDSTVNDLYLTYIVKNLRYYSSIVVQLFLYNENDLTNPIASSPLYNLTNRIPGDKQSTPDRWFNYDKKIDAPVETIYGHFIKNGDKYTFKSDDGYNTFKATFKDVPRVDRGRISIMIQGGTSLAFGWGYLATSDILSTTDNNTVKGYAEVITSNNTLTANWESSVSSGALITKETLLRTENTPADYLLSYSKLFGLYFTKDIDSKTIRIYTRNNFFKNIISDWSKRIDYSKDFTINPLIFDKKWYTMSLDTPETYYANKYNKEYGIVYGQQRLDTGYNFNADNVDLYTDNVYNNTITARATDKYFRTFRNSSSVYVPCFMNDNISYSLYKTGEGNNIDLYGINYIDTTKTAEWYNIAGNDIFPKTCFYSLSNDEWNLEEITSTILFYNGHINMKDLKGNSINYWITDDVPEMIALNGDPCYLYTVNELNLDGKSIAIKIDTLPQYIRYNINNVYIKSSLDFGLPRELYIDNIGYPEDTTIYCQYWKSFYNDQFNVNTKKVTCFVRLDDLDVRYDLLRQFYYFEDSYWLLNKIDSYDINSDSTVRCEFIKVQDINNYTNGGRS